MIKLIELKKLKKIKDEQNYIKTFYQSKRKIADIYLNKNNLILNQDTIEILKKRKKIMKK